MGCVKSKGKMTNFRRERVDDRMIQNVLLVWLDIKVDCQNTIDQLRQVINTIHTFIDAEQCIEFLEKTTDEKVCLLISGSFAEQIVPRIHHLAQINSIVIFCGIRKYDRKWTEDWSKIKGAFAKIGLVCDALKEAAQQCEQNAISISILGDRNAGALEKTGNRLDPSFIYTQIAKEILLIIKFEQAHIDDFIDYCQEILVDNARQLQNVHLLAREYHQHTPIWWYTYDCFLYPMLNRALRTMDADLMIKVGFFIADLHRHIEQLHQQQFSTDSVNQCFTVYRGQGMDKDALQNMVNNEGGLISFNCFLSTSKKHSTSLNFARRALSNLQIVGVLFVMNIDSKQSSTPFASVAEVGCYGAGEDEVLFSMHTVFRIGKTTLVDGNTRLVQVQLNLVNDNNNDLRELIDSIREETFPNEEGWYRLSLVLWKMGEHAQAQQVYEGLLEQKTDESDKISIYHQLGIMKDEQGQYVEAIAYYEKSIEIGEKQIPRNDQGLASSYIAIGNSYENMGAYFKALSFHEKALAMKQQSLPSTHPDLALSYKNIGIVYHRMGDYSEALSSYEKALSIEQQSHHPTHPALAASYNNIGAVYYIMSDYPKALSFHEKALSIRHQSLPPTHSDLSSSYSNIGLVYRGMDEYAKALLFYEKALAIQQQSLSPTHPDLTSSYIGIGNLYVDMGNYPIALSFYEKALSIQQQSLPPTHPELAISYDNIGTVYYNTCKYSKALSSYEKALAIRQQSFPPLHPYFAHSYFGMGNAYCRLGSYPKAFLAYELALTIQKQAICSNDFELATTFNYLGLLYDCTGKYWKAHLCYEHAVDLAQCSVRSNHPSLQRWRYNLARMKQKL